MIEFELYIDDHFVYSQRSNGLIISTPTGSTAYALSGGGPIMYPSLDAVVLVPISPHTLTARPIVVDGNSHIKIIPGNLHDTYAMVSCDGHVDFTIEGNEEVHIGKMADELTLIHPLLNNFYETCRRKLGWGIRLSG
jgi:NAD+ kinase